MKAEPPILVAGKGNVARVTLRRAPSRNAITLAMWEKIGRTFTTFSKSKTIRLVVIDSAVPGVFSAGADLKEFERLARDRALRRRYLRAVKGALKAVMNCPAQTVALIRGACFGGGLALALACDMRIASADAAFAVSAARIGLVYPLQEVARLVAIAGKKEAAKLLLTAKVIGAKEAAKIGLINVILGAKGKGGRTNGNGGKGRLSPYSLRAMRRFLALAAKGKTSDTRETDRLFLHAFDGPGFRAALKRFGKKS